MHIPDGFLDAKTFITLDVVGAGLVATAAARVRRVLNERSGHFAGGALAAILLGPWAAVLVMTLVLVIQALAFGDGGILVLGANIFNMAVVAPFVGYGIYRLSRGLSRSGVGSFVGAFVAGWVAVVAAASACAAQLAISGTIPVEVVFPAMVAVHALIGVGEGLITALALGAVRASRPDLLELARGGAAR
jgi:cobalt/nickel transport system permease protein